MKYALWNSAAALLLVTGSLLGLTFPLGKIATDQAVPPVVWAFLISAGAASVLFVAMLLRGDAFRPDPGKLRYYAIAGLITYAIPNMLVFLSIPRLGAGFTGLMFTLSPVLTLAMALGLRLRRPNLLGVAGIATGFAGAVVVALTRGEIGEPADIQWIALGLLIPLTLATGNIYRTLDWPADAGSLELAVGSHLASALALALLGLTPAADFDLGALARAPAAAAAQVAASAAMFAFFFRLQAVGGPVYLSQIGYVGAAVGLASATLFLGERYAALTWAGALVIGVGVILTTKAQTSGAKT